ncbi:MAG: KamA family radical SAM protein [Armatimonadetes bacterium]|nr:KamA family radical SAM protein [Armatimonadota bacterium]
MLERRSRHIEELADYEPAIAKQFVASAREFEYLCDESSDPLMEDEHELVRGLIHKYENRVLCLLTAECAAYCRFCTRRRMVSDIERGAVKEEDIGRWVDYLQEHPEVKEVILSGGDPFVVPSALFRFSVERISSVPSIKVLRIGTRVPVTAPELVNEEKLEVISSLRQPVYIGIHFEHPAELTEATIDAVVRLRRAGAILYSQTVFLSGINDDYETLHELFSRLTEIGVRPYYIYRCDPVAGAGHFRADFAKERRIMTALRKNLSGLACPTYVIDTPRGSGKIPVPLEFWDADCSVYRDFCGDIHSL